MFEQFLTGEVEVGVAEDCGVLAEELHFAAVLEANSFIEPKIYKTRQIVIILCIVFKCNSNALSQSAEDELELVVAREENSTRVLSENIRDTPRSHVTDHLPLSEQIGGFEVGLREHGVELTGARELTVCKKYNQILIHIQTLQIQRKSATDQISLGSLSN